MLGEKEGSAMQYRVMPFVASLSSKEGSSAAAQQLERLCNEQTAQGWEFMGLETVETFIAGSSGCFGIGATPSVSTSFSMAVFRK